MQAHAHDVLATVTPLGGSQSTLIGGDLMGHNQARTGNVNGGAISTTGGGDSQNLQPYRDANYLIKT